MKSFSTTSKDSITTVAIGGFDGIHLAHQELIKRAEALMIINKYKANLTPGEYRCRFVKKPCFFYELEDIKRFGCDEFALFLKKEFLNLKKVVVGYDFRYGFQRRCVADDLKKYFNIEVVDEVIVDDISVHSGVIREFIKKGKVKEVMRFLGRTYSIEGKVISGQGLGKKELVPTVNVNVCDFLLPSNGVYATKTEIDGKFLDSVTFVGVRYTTDGCFSVETHLIDEIVEVCSGEVVEVSFFERIRDNQKFNSLNELKNRIEKDIDMSREVLKVKA